jgi:peptide/nickel transport system substrate-binding protein
MSLDPAVSLSASDYVIIKHVYETLLQAGAAPGQLGPGLARNWSVAPDQLSWSFELRSGVTFHDGTPCDAAAVVFTFKRLLQANFRNRNLPYPPQFYYMLRQVSDITRLDDLRVVFKLKAPYPALGSALTSSFSSIISPQALREKRQDFAKSACGTGPWKTVSITPRLIVLERNENYWGSRPTQKRMRLFFEDNSLGLAKMLRDGQIDIMAENSRSALLNWRSAGKMRVQSMESPVTTFLLLNPHSPRLKRQEIRQAMMWAWDPHLIPWEFHDMVSPWDQIVPRGLIRDLPPWPYPHSIDQAQKLLRQANALNAPVVVAVLAESGVLSQALEKYCRNLQRAGFEVTIKRLPRDFAYNFKDDTSWDTIVISWFADSPDHDHVLYSVFMPEMAAFGQPTITFPGSEQCRLWLTEAASCVDPVRRMDLYRQVCNTVIREAWVLPLYQERLFFISRTLDAMPWLAPIGWPWQLVMPSK